MNLTQDLSLAVCQGLEMPKRNIACRFSCAIFLFAAFPVCPAVAQQMIGSAASLRNQVEGVIGQGSQRLQTGSEVYQNELVRTGEASVVQLVFLDSTDLKVGPKSEVTLDRFVYDPDRAAGAVVVRAGRGIFRFVTGSQQKQNYLIQTPVASIGVRGTIFDLLVLPDRITVILVEGEIQVTTLLGRVVALTQPGQSVTVFASGAVTGPRPWRGKIYVDFADAQFPYFEPVPVQTPERSTRPVIRQTSISTERPPRRSGRQVETELPRRQIDLYTWRERHKRQVDNRYDRDKRRVDTPRDKRRVDNPRDNRRVDTPRDRRRVENYTANDGNKKRSDKGIKNINRMHGAGLRRLLKSRFH